MGASKAEYTLGRAKGMRNPGNGTMVQSTALDAAFSCEHRLGTNTPCILVRNIHLVHSSSNRAAPCPFLPAVRGSATERGHLIVHRTQLFG